jgi:hypothetical protein
VSLFPAVPVRGLPVTITYNPVGRPLAGATTVRLYRGINNWASVTTPDLAMTKLANGTWQASYVVPATANQIDFVFNNGSGTWDNNGGADWHQTTATSPQISGRVSISPNPVVKGQPLTVTYDPRGGSLANATSIRLHKGINNWATTDSPDVVMTQNATTGYFQHTYTVPASANQVDFVFNNGSGTWDNNGGADWHYPASTQATYTSLATEDGQITESTETSNVGGTVAAAGTTARIGDDTAKKQCKTLLSFDTSAIPDGAVISAATLTIYRVSAVGNPTALGTINLHARKGAFSGANGLATGDFAAAATSTNAGSVPFPAANGPVNIALHPAGIGAVNKTGRTQFRLQFATDDNNNTTADALNIAMSNHATVSYRPVLRVTYR